MPPVALKPRTSAPRATAPAVPVRQYSFTDWQTNNPTSPPPGDRMDAEYDQSNTSISQTIAWAGTSLNTDGSIRDAIIGENNLKPGLFDSISSDAIADLQPLVSEAINASGQAVSSASEADASALAAANQNTAAQSAADDAETFAAAAELSAEAALISQQDAANSSSDAANDANSTAGDVAICTDYGVLTQAWAEHMPDTIPPNILAVMGVTGDHWSSRWWANRANLNVEEGICDLQHYWMGAYANPPTHNTCGDPVVAGAMYFNLTDQVCYVYDGATWHSITQLAPGQHDDYLYLPSTPTTVFTGPDYHGNTLTLDVPNSEIGVYLNGVRLLKGIDYSVTGTSVTMLLGSVTAPNSVEILALHDASAAPVPHGLKVNTNIWVFDGVTQTFPIQDSGGAGVVPPGAVDCLVSLNGVLQEAGGDFTVTGSSITFITAPEADADKWMVVGLPVGAGTLATADAPAATSGDLFLARLEPFLARITALETRVAVLESLALP